VFKPIKYISFYSKYLIKLHVSVQANKIQVMKIQICIMPYFGSGTQASDKFGMLQFHKFYLWQNAVTENPQTNY